MAAPGREYSFHRSVTSAMASSSPRQVNRWGSIGSPTAWNSFSADPDRSSAAEKSGWRGSLMRRSFTIGSPAGTVRLYQSLCYPSRHAMPHADPSSFRLPDLRFVAVDLLVPHEKEDQRRTESLAVRLRESGLLRNPPIVTPAGSDERFVVLDGANRGSTVRAAGFPHLVVPAVRYYD